jgi:hypothetical protein
VSRTAKWEHPTDGHNITRRLERCARPAGRDVTLIAGEHAADDDGFGDPTETAAERAAAAEWAEMTGGSGSLLVC